MTRAGLPVADQPRSLSVHGSLRGLLLVLGRPALVVQWHRVGWETVVESSYTGSGDESYVRDQQTAGSATVRQAGWLVLVARPKLSGGSDATVQLDSFPVRTAPAGLEAVSIAPRQVPTWEEIRRILEAGP